MNRSAIIAFGAIAFAFASTASADTITRISPQADRVVLVNGQATMNFMVSGQSTEGDCGIWIDYGDQGSPDTRIIGRRDGELPREFVHTFGRAGQFTVTAKGRSVKTTPGCAGEVSTVITVAEAGRERGRGRTAEAACPAGWELREGSFERTTGAFTCDPAYPQARINCGRDLRYFERDNTIGCRERGESRR